MFIISAGRLGAFQWLQHVIHLARPSHMPSVCTVHSLWEGVKAVGLLGVREGHSHARGERGVEDDCSTLIARSQVHRGHSANALAVHDHVLWPNAIPKRGKWNMKITLLVIRNRVFTLLVATNIWMICVCSNRH